MRGLPSSSDLPLLDPEYRTEGNSVWREWQRVATLIKHLVRRSLALRYRGSSLGFAWSLLNPMLLMVIYTFVFEYVFGTRVPGVPYPAFFLTGQLAWNCVNTGAMSAAVSMLDGSALLKKAAFPLHALPVSAVLANAVNYLMTLPVLLLFNLLFGVTPKLSLLLFPVALFLLILVATSVGLLLAAIIPRFRDVQHLIEVLFVSWFFLSPVMYPMAQITPKLSHGLFVLYALNPMVGIMQLVHSAFFDQPLPVLTLSISLCSTLVLFSVGLWVFNRLAKDIAEI